jgi:hypothetical protein
MGSAISPLYLFHLTRTPDILAEAAVCFREAAWGMEGRDRFSFISYAVHCLFVAKAMKANPDYKSKERFLLPAGTWVQLRGMTGKQESMNGKIGQILHTGTTAEVRVAGMDSVELIPSSCLKKLPITDRMTALVACLEDDAQWIVIRMLWERIVRRVVAKRQLLPFQAS